MRVALILLLFYIANSCLAQQGGYTAFTVNDGLPSNYVYRCIEDDKGFLWVATDAGIARFDGKHFQVFTTADGLPDNEVLDVVKEKNGRIWVNCFKQGPCYFDEQKNKFFNANTDTNLAKTGQATIMAYVYALNNGGVMYLNERGCFVFKNKQLTEGSALPYNDFFLVREDSSEAQLHFRRVVINPALKIFNEEIFATKNGKIKQTVVLRRAGEIDYPMTGLNDDNFYTFYALNKKIFIYSKLGLSPVTYKADSISVPETFFYYGFTGNWLNIYCHSGKIYSYDKHTLKLQSVMSGDYIPNAMYKDSRGNIWVSTVDKGLLLYKNIQFTRVKMPGGFTNTNFLSICFTKYGTLLAGNYSGQVLQSAAGVTTIHPSPTKNTVIFRQRKILFMSKKVFTFSENGVYVNFKRQLGYKKGHFFGKTAIAYNDSNIIIGITTAIIKMNAATEKISLLNSPRKRITALAKANNNYVYYGSTDGLYKYDVEHDTGWAIKPGNPLLAERVTGICATPDSLLWVSTASNGIIVLKNDLVISHFASSQGLINNAARSIVQGRNGQIWVGTWAGISVINYTLANNKINKYSIQNLSVNDGLVNNVINEMAYYHDTVYAATSDGISIIPANVTIPRFNIPVQLIKISINQRDTAIATAYNLPYNQRYIQMQLAGIELGGHFKRFEYTLDKNSNWLTLTENVLALQLTNGKHMVQVRAVDVNGNVSNAVFSVTFTIATPFWMATWFWITVVILLQLVTLLAVARWLKKKRELKLAKQMAIIQTAALEQQAFTSLINPHFMFNALNSIQHYINLQDRKNANRYLSDFASLIRKNFEASQKSFISLEEEIENVKIYLRLEQMRFSGRFNYEVNIAENTDIDEWMVPTMMLQPFLENALLHGIMPSKKEGQININIETKDNNLVLTVADNGIGIANSKALKLGTDHSSLGIELIEKRIAALSRVSTKVISISFSSLCTDEENPGTKIVLFMEQGLYQAWLHAQKN